MRSLGTIRTRVERLATACLPSPVPLVIFHEQCRYTPCPACGADLQAHAQALAVARADRARGVAHVVEYDEWTRCPRCDVPLP
jgi:hypothetical protein